VFEGEGKPVFGDVADVDFGGAEGAGGLGGDDADGAGAGDQDPAAGLDFRAFAGPEPTESGSIRAAASSLTLSGMS
jgi:hypothetical protein